MNGTSRVSGADTELYYLGLSTDQIRVSPNFRHRDITASDFGPEVPPEVMANILDANISMVLFHYDERVLDFCVAEALGGLVAGQQGAGMMPGAGLPLGNNLPLLASGNHYVNVQIYSPQLGRPWNFPSAYLTNPLSIPLGTHATEAAIAFRAIPYRYHRYEGSQPLDVFSSGAVVWDRDITSFAGDESTLIGGGGGESSITSSG